MSLRPLPSAPAPAPDVIPSAESFRSPPYNPEAEMGVVGSMLLDNGVVDDVALVLRPADFFRDDLRTLYESILALRDRGVPVDALLLADDLRGRSVLGDSAIVELLGDVMESTPHSANARYYAEVVHSKAVARELIDSADAIARDGYSDRYATADLLARAQSAVFSLSDNEVRPRHAHASEAATESMDCLSRRRDGEVVGLSTGLAGLDRVVDGFHPGQMIILAARPSVGKSALALNMAWDVACTQKAPVLFVSLEMGRKELTDRLLSSASGVFGSKFRSTDDLSPADLAAIDRAYSRVRDSRLYIDDTPGMDLAQVAALARRQKSREGLEFLVVDYLQRLRFEVGRGETFQNAVGRMSNRVKDLARELDIPILVLCQLNRDVEGREGHRPRMSDLRDSGALEQDADMVLMLHRPDYYRKDDRPGEADLLVEKQRAGSPGVVPLVFEKSVSRFVDIPPGEPS